MAHGLVLKLEEMVLNSRKNSISTNLKVQDLDMHSHESEIVDSWLKAAKKYSRFEFVSLLRTTLLHMLSPQWMKGTLSHEILEEFKVYCHKFHVVIKNCKEICRAVCSMSRDPWQNVFFLWDDLFQKKLNIEDKKVQEYFSTEPEEIVLARVHSLILSKNEDKALTLAEFSFLYHSRIAKDILDVTGEGKTAVERKSRAGFPSMDWYLFILQRKKSLPAIINEVKRLSCHEGLLLISKLRKNSKNKNFAHALLQIFLVQDLVLPSKYCCTKKFFSLWCIMHREAKSGLKDITESARKLFADHAPTSAHFYLLVDSLWEQFGTRFLALYVELYVRGLTLDINYWEAARNSDVSEDVEYFKTHISSMFAKLSTLFVGYYDEAARECMFSAFSLRPTKKRLCLLQRLAIDVLSNKEENPDMYSMDKQSVSFKECKCSIQCNGSCKSTISRFNLTHPLLNRGIPNVPYMLVKDLVCILECVRCFNFQYNVFAWERDFTGLSAYEESFNQNNSKDVNSNVELASDVNYKSDFENEETEANHNVARVNLDPVYTSSKRKILSNNTHEVFSFDIGANIEVKSDENVSKKLKILEQETVKTQNAISNHPFNQNKISWESSKQLHNSGVQMNDAIENVIRMSLDKGISETTHSASTSKYSGKSFTCSDSGTSSLPVSIVDTRIPADRVAQPFSFGACGIKQNLPSQSRTYYENVALNLKSSMGQNQDGNVAHYNRPDNSMFASSVKYTGRDSVVVSPNMESKDVKKIFMQNVSYPNSNSVPNSVVKTISLPFPNQMKTIDSLSNLNTGVAACEREALNLSCNSKYEQLNTKNEYNTSSPSLSDMSAISRLTADKSSISSFHSNSYSSYYPNTSYAASFNRQKLNLTQTGETAHQSVNYFKNSQTSLASSKHVPNKTTEFSFNSESKIDQEINQQNMTYYDGEKQIQCDRNSVIQHTMQHTDRHAQIPSPMSVSVSSSAVQHIRNNAKKEACNLLPFTMNISDKAIPKTVTASLLVARKPHHITPVSSVQSTVPNMASQSVIMNPAWEAYRKSHGDVQCRKNLNATSTSNIKRIYKQPSVMQSSVILKNQSDGSQNKNINEKLVIPDQILKSQLTASQNNFPNVSHHWQTLNTQGNVASTTVTSSQSWYTVPYSNSSTAEKVNITNCANTAVNSREKLFLPLDSHQQLSRISDSPKSFSASTSSLYSTSHLPARNTSLPSPAYREHSTHHFASSSSPTIHTSASMSTPQMKNICVMPKKQFLNKNFSQTTDVSSAPSPLSSSSSASTNTTTYASVENDSIRNISNSPSDYIHRVLDRNDILVADKRSPVVFSASQTFPVSQYSHSHSVSDDIFTTACCSPLEANPCQSCSSTSKTSATYAEPKLLNQSSGVNSRTSNTISPETASVTNKSKNMGISNEQPYSLFHYPDETIVMCQFCSFSCPPSELESHILRFHDEKMSELFSEDRNQTKVLSPDIPFQSTKLTAQQSIDVSEQQNLLHQISETGESQNSNFEYVLDKSSQFFTEDDENENSKIMEENAFSLCMDIINSENDFKEIVQGVNSFEHMENYSAPPVPCTSQSYIFPNHSDFQNVSHDNELGLSQGCNFSFSGNEIYDNQAFPANKESIENFSKDSRLLYTEKDFENVFNFPEKEKEYEQLNKPSFSNDKLNEESYQLSPLSMAGEARVMPLSSSENSNNLLQNHDGRFSNEAKEECKVSNPVIFFHCKFCKRKLRSAAALRRHEIKFHQIFHRNDESSRPQEQLAGFPIRNCISDGRKISKTNSSFPSSNIKKIKKECNLSGNADATKTVLDLDTSEIIYNSGTEIKKNANHSSTVSFGNEPMIKYKGKNLVKSPLSRCKYCGKMLTSVYIKKHILKRHSGVLTKYKNLTELSSFSHEFRNVPVCADANSTPSQSVSDAANIFNVSNSSVVDHASPDSDNNLCKVNSLKQEMCPSDSVDQNQSYPNNSSKSHLNFENKGKKKRRSIPITSEINKCYICNKSYCTYSYLKKHMLSVHGSNCLEGVHWSKLKKRRTVKLNDTSVPVNTESSQSITAASSSISLHQDELHKSMTNKVHVISLQSSSDNDKFKTTFEDPNFDNNEMLNHLSASAKFYRENNSKSSGLVLNNKSFAVENSCELNVKTEKSETSYSDNMIDISTPLKAKNTSDNDHLISLQQNEKLYWEKGSLWSQNPNSESLISTEKSTNTTVSNDDSEDVPYEMFNNTANISVKCNDIMEGKEMFIDDRTSENKSFITGKKNSNRNTYSEKDMNPNVEQSSEAKILDEFSFNNSEYKDCHLWDDDDEDDIINSKESESKRSNQIIDSEQNFYNLDNNFNKKSEMTEKGVIPYNSSSSNGISDFDKVSCPSSEKGNNEVASTSNVSSPFNSLPNSKSISSKVSKLCISAVQSKSSRDKIVPVLKLSKVSKGHVSDSFDCDSSQSDEKILTQCSSKFITSAWQCVSNPGFESDENSCSNDSLRSQQCDTAENSCNTLDDFEKISSGQGTSNDCSAKFNPDSSVAKLEAGGSVTVKQHTALEYKRDSIFHSDLYKNAFQKKRMSKHSNSYVKMRKLTHVCRLCSKKFLSMSSLSKHLKSIHDVPLLKKCSVSDVRPKLYASNLETPPSLSLFQSCDSDSTSASTEVSLQTQYSKNVTEKMNLRRMNESSQSSHKLQLALYLDSNTENSSKLKGVQNFRSLSSLKDLPSNSNVHVSCKHRRHSFCDIKSSRKYYEDRILNSMKIKCSHSRDIIEPQCQIQKSFDFKNSLSKQGYLKLRRRSTSSSNMLVGKSILSQNITDASYIESQSIFSSTVNSEVKYNSKNHMKSLNMLNDKSYNNDTFIPNQEETVNSYISGLSSQNSLSSKVPQVSKNLSKLSKKKKRSQSLNSDLLTLQRPIDIAEFLKTQPVVKLTRLKNNHLTKLDSPNVGIKAAVSQPVVKLKRLDFSDDIFHACQKKIMPSALLNNTEKLDCDFHMNCQTVLCSADTAIASQPKSPPIQGSSLQQKPKLSLIVRRINTGLNPNYAVSHTSCDESPKENFIDRKYQSEDINFNSVKYCNLPLTKKCCVLLKKLAV